MSTQPERLIVDRVIAHLRSLPRCWAAKIHGGPYQAAGIPDVLACVDGRFVALEVKVPGKKPTRLQALVIRRIIDAGGIAGCVTSVDEVSRLLEDAGIGATE